MVDLVGDQVAVAVVFDQQRPAQPVGITGLGLVEVARIAQVGIVVEIQGGLAGDIVGIEIGVVLVEVEEHRAERPAVGGVGEADAPDDLVSQVVRPHVVEIGVVGGVVGLGIGELEGGLFFVDQGARIFDRRVPVLHVERHAGVQRLGRGRSHVDVAVGVVLLVEAFLGLGQVVEHELVRVVERRAAGRLGRKVFRAQHDAQFRLGRVRLIGLAEGLEQLGIAERTHGVDLARVLLELLDVGVADFVGHHLVDAVEVEIAVADHLVEGGVNRFELQVGRAYVPAPERAVGIGIAFDGIDQVGLDVGQQGEVAAVKRVALERGVDAGERLLGVGEGAHGLLLRDGRTGVLVQARGGADKYREGRKVEFYIA